MRLIVAGIGTEVGKTVVSAAICAGLQATGAAHYWKPVQAGDLDNSDTHKVVRWSGATALPETHRLNTPMSPHAAAAIDGITLDLDSFTPPAVDGPLVTELAGGLMVPLSDRALNIDLIGRLGDPVVLVASFYLGSINHSLLSLALLRERGIPLAGIVFSGTPVASSREAILHHSGARLLYEMPNLDPITPETLTVHGQAICQQLRVAGF